MTKRTTWPMRVDAGVKTVGTARVRDDSRPKMTAAQKAVFDATGNRPQVDAGFDDIGDGIGAPSVLTPAYRQPDAKARMQALGRLRTGEMNKTEQRYADHLEARKQAGEVAWYRFEGIKFRLADNTFYTPDFAVMLVNGQLEAHEVKGHWQDDARVKVKVAADQYPVRFIAVKAGRARDGGGWQTEEF
ncbi:hypothetical protein DIE11_34145 [Burkholderia sp. Bp9012]|uniref:hypothetical protein n=1 Tax=Burkholderia sp. Bp9012 TaxID=2184562 RepID=UPI000F59E114|nr:hypothetical protein [Burkholderia sp. Bp9012]RQR68973.1 hypothetical protein DIE11_34145 [Burkholderia sp. Bp9012]